MATTQKLLIGLLVYYVLAVIVVSLVSITGQLTENVVTRTGNFQESNQNVTTINDNVGVFSIGDTVSDVFSVFVFDISLYDGNEYLMQYFWIFRLLFSYIPALILIITFLMFLRGI